MKTLTIIAFFLILFYAPKTVQLALAQDSVRPENASSLKTFRSEKYKFQFQYPQKCRIIEFPGEPPDSYITKFWISCDYNETNIQVFKREDSLKSSETLRSQVMEWMGWTSWPEKQMTTYTIGSRPAIRQDYLYGVEPPETPPPAVNVWTFNDNNSFWVACCCGKEACDSSISRFSFIE